MEIRTTPILKYLELNQPEYFGKVLEMREAVRAWLNYIPHTFPHYTRHTIEHSEEIIHQISNLLFRPENPTAPIVSVSPTEFYILVAAAYLHDSGMVTSDKEKITLLSSDEWRDWIGPGGGGEKRNAEIDAFLLNTTIADSQTRRFLADVQLRFLIAEFVRQRHHLRAADVIQNHENALGRFAFGDQMLARAISDICVAHGLHRRELEDKERFSEERDIRHDKVNIRFLAILLRLGDLLDISHDRACPLLLNAAAPVPIDSFPHWAQYRGIYHRRTSPDAIEISATCDSQEEHRVLYDWCKWIEEEIASAAVLMSHAPRHRSWTPPVARLDDSGTIQIRAAPSASYKFTKWQLQLDQPLILDLLIRNLYSESNAFLRELIQNALDAIRCQIFLDLYASGRPTPECLSHVTKDERSAYALRIELFTRSITNDLSGEAETRQIIAIDDCGIGMDRDVIERFFLQVGRSFYTTPEFRRRYNFHPTSKFGIGFLSVFQVSDHVVVDTHKPSSRNIDGPLRLTLTGPRNYLLTETSSREKNGTRIELMLRKGEELSTNELTTYVTNLCRRVEFPILVNDLGRLTTIEAENILNFVRESRSHSDSDASFQIRGFPITKPLVDGEIYVFSYTNKSGEFWDRHHWARYSYVPQYPRAEIPELPPTLRCLHGLSVEAAHGGYSNGYTYRIDYRGSAEYTTASREQRSRRRLAPDPIYGRHETSGPPEEVADDLARILTAHLDACPSSKGPMAWAYKQDLVDDFPFPRFWDVLPNTIRVFNRTIPTFTSLAQLIEVASFVVLLSPSWYTRTRLRSELTQNQFLNDPAQLEIPWDDPTIIDGDLRRISGRHRKKIFLHRKPREVFSLATGHVAVRWEKISGTAIGLHAKGDEDSNFVAPVRLASEAGHPIFAICPHHARDDTYEVVIYNCDHPFVQWMIRVQAACNSGRNNMSSAQFHRLLAQLKTPLHHHGFRLSELTEFLKKWNADASLPAELLAPALTLADLSPAKQ